MAKKSKGSTAKTEKVDLRRLKKEERPAPSTGQSGPQMTLPAEKINKDERLVLKDLNDGDRTPMKIVDIADSIRKAKRNEFTPLRVRNALRRLVRAGLVAAKARGEYKITAKGSKVTEGIDEVPLPAKGAKSSSKPKAKKEKAPKAEKVAAAPKEPKAPKSSKKKAKQSASPKAEDDADDTPTPVESTTDFTDEVETELAQFGAKFKRGTPHYKGAIVVAAIRTAGLSDSTIAKVTGLSRGFCVPRVKRLKEAGLTSPPETDEEFANAVAVAEGVAAKNAPEPTEPESAGDSVDAI